jgi:prepilin-type processing-associated H-X9-DG protein
MNTTRPFALKKAGETGFTLTDLLVVIVTVAVLGLLLLPALAGTKPNSQAFQCLENLRQLTLGWQMYAEDNNGKLPPNGQQSTQSLQPTDSRYLPGGAWAQWCPGMVSAYYPYATELIKAGLIYPYVNNTNIYRCPSDLRAFRNFGIIYPQARSYSMNCCIAPLSPSVNWNSPSLVRVFYKDTDFTQPGPSATFVLIDENEQSINDTLLCVGPTDLNHWQDAPATRHAGAGSISFADGHSEMKRWTDRFLLQVPTIFSTGVGHASDPNSADWAWLSQRTTVRY